MIKVENLTKVYTSKQKKVSVFEDLNLLVDKGECFLIKGPSGSGKSTFLKIIGCLTKPTSGRFSINGKVVSHLPEHFLVEIRREMIGFVFQEFNLMSGYTSLKNIGLPLIPCGYSEAERNRMSMELLIRVNLKDRAHFFVNELSGGEQQRVAIARAIINNPHILLADEPTSNVDDQNAKMILDILKDLKTDGKTILIASHDPFITSSGIVDSTLVL